MADPSDGVEFRGRPDPQLSVLVRLAAHVARAPVAAVSVIDRDRFVVTATLGTRILEFDRTGTICGWVADHAEVTVVDDLSSDPRFAASPAVTGPPYFRSYAGVPVRARDGSCTAVLSVADTVRRRFDADTGMLEVVAAQVAQHLHSRRGAGELAVVGGDDAVAEPQLTDDLFQVAFRNAQTPMLIRSPRGRILDVNDATCRLLGRESDDLVGRDLTVLFAPESYVRDAPTRERLVSGELATATREIDLVHADGRRIPVVATTSVVRAADGSPRLLLLHGVPRAPSEEDAERAGRIRLADGVVVDVPRREVTWGGTQVPLTRLEFDVLVHLVSHSGRVCSREELLQHVWHSSSEYQQARTVSEHVHRLRTKLPTLPITTVHGVGYRFDLTAGPPRP